MTPSADNARTPARFAFTDGRDAAACFITDADGRVLLVRTTMGMWMMPGGKFEPGEGPEQCAVRECTEEVGQAPQLGRLLGIHRVSSAYSPRVPRGRWRTVYFFAADLTLDQTAELTPQPEEVVEIAWLSIDDAATHMQAHHAALLRAIAHHAATGDPESYVTLENGRPTPDHPALRDRHPRAR
ncbi:NUDIX domain-containing protein [Yinghuangia soli]|uniref:NUDIX hydrolase n=1 Tax=Yinghuangia soli TaxID=2908204 RepID=A0AA41U2I3_9ACTN|nr:NUDIX hydrolase [Yinghuangia soli]MCF2527144.1 NUDIX hydrolase [Yinghuangia soli]